jgi:phosphoribosyl 1,2-cyclic phosphate phosphodiesterase
VRVEILGSAGAVPTPRPGCDCGVCSAAREQGGRHARTGPSVFLHGPDVLFDTPEETRLQLGRAGIQEVAACFYSHWHPDHTMGRRLWETMNSDFRAWPWRVRRETPIYLPEQVATDFGRFLGLREHFEFLEERGWVRVEVVPDGERVELDGWTVAPVRLAQDYVYAFEIERDGRRLLLALDELKDWDPPAALRDVELAVLPMGICEHDPFSGERRIHRDHPVLRLEATFVETLRIVERLGAKRVVLAHIEEIDGLTYDDLVRLGGEVGVEFAYDGMVLEL